MTSEAPSTEYMKSHLARILEDSAVLPDAELDAYAVDGVTPKAVALPSSEDQLAAVLGVAYRQKWAVAPWGNGSLVALGGKPERLDLVIGLKRFAAAIDHAPGDLTATVGAGTALRELQETLAKEGQWLPVDPPLADQQTIGGVLATDVPGPLSLGYGTLRDMVLGMRVVGPDGVVTKSGGRVVKNVTGFDIGKAHIGALGTLGIILEASFKVAPLPKRDVSLMAVFSTLSKALDASQQMLRHPTAPESLEVALLGINRRQNDGSRSAPGSMAYARFFASEQVMDRRLQVCRDILWQAGADNVEVAGGKAASDTWKWLADFGWDSQAGPGLLVRLGCLPSRMGELAGKLEGFVRRYGYEASFVIGSGRGAAKCFLPGVKWLDSNVTGDVVGEMRGIAEGVGGYALVEKCPPEAKDAIDVWGDVGQGAALMRRLKDQMDPEGILNSGRFVGGI